MTSVTPPCSPGKATRSATSKPSTPATVKKTTTAPGTPSHVSKPGTAKKHKKKKHKVEEQMDPMEGHYTGNHVDGLRDGEGELVFLNGDSYKGMFYRGMRHGQGMSRLFAGFDSRTGDKLHNSYLGNWKKSMREGTGVETWPGRMKYEGEFTADKYHGKGMLIKGSTKYAGDFEKGEKSGYGFMVFSNNATYEGEWQNNRMEGWGEYILPDGARFEGGWEHGLKSGLGMFTQTNGERFDGNWKAGNKHGEGVFRWNNGKTRTGVWKDNKLVQWTGNESFGVIVTFSKGRPPRLNKKGNLKIIKDLKG
ncbi:hypothetical protein ScalyP_jg4768 [Parmales sp. scaly parma]|nr:hypothetical protein ScalyP_jg4768 [Parmales sp. scaly parma]|tara:strand:+ start:31 stop:951 length:921 start_codon:yes stop_codon:yes gene_type:complete